MPEKTPGPYYANETGVWKASIARKNPDGSTNHTLGFRICKPLADYIQLGALEGSDVMVEMLNRAERYDDMIAALQDAIAALQDAIAALNNVIAAVSQNRIEDGRFVEDRRQE